MRVFVELSRGVDAQAWARKHAEGRAADRTPYGLHHLQASGHDVLFRRPLESPALRSLAARVEGRLEQMQIVHGVAALSDPARRRADVVLCMDERNGLPAALLPGGPPVVTGVAWLEDPADFPDWYVQVARQGLARAAAVFVECRPMLEPLETEFGVSPDKLHFVTLGIDSEHFRPAESPPVPGRVFSVGDDRMRDYATLTAALETVRRAQPGVSAEIATTLRVPLPEWAEVHRRRMDDAVRACYARAEVVALALHGTKQGSGLTVILEAMASGRPLVVTDNPGLDDYVEHGVTGLLVPPRDPDAMAEAVSGLLRDPQRAAEMGRAGRRVVEERFSSDRFAAALDDVLRSVDGAR